MSNERYTLVDKADRFSEVIRLNVRAKHYGWREINIGDHLSAVLVFGANQDEADTRAEAIVKAMNADAHPEEPQDVFVGFNGQYGLLGVWTSEADVKANTQYYTKVKLQRAALPDAGGRKHDA